MVTINHEDVSYKSELVPLYSENAPKISFSELQEKIDNKMSEIHFIINESMGFDIKELRIKYFYAEIEKAIVKKPKTKTSSRYKV